MIENGFIIDLDYAEFSDFTYNIAEIELVVENDEHTKEAIDKIISFAHEQGLSQPAEFGKIFAYIKAKKPEHYRAMINSGNYGGATKAKRKPVI